MSPRQICALARSLLWAWLVICASAGAASQRDTAAQEPAYAQDDRWRGIADVTFRHLGAPDMRFASAITQDGQGFLWLATQAGVVRWDGYRAKSYRADPQDPHALPDNYVMAVHTDELGRLWVGTSSGGLALYDPDLDRFVLIGAGARGLDGPDVTVIAADGSRGLWVGTASGLNHVDLATNAIRLQPMGREASGSVKSVLQDPDGGLWVGTDKGLVYRAPHSTQFMPVVLDVHGGAPATVCALFRDSVGNLWIGTRPYGAFVLERGASLPKAVNESGNESRVNSESILSIVEPTPGEIWLGSSGRGILRVHLSNGKTNRLRHHVDEPATLQDDDVHAMYRDRSGLIWVSSTMALSMHDPRRTGISTLFGAPTDDRPITAVQVPVVLAMPDGHVWLSAGDDGAIDILDPKLGRVGEIRENPAQPRNSLPPGRVLTMAAAPSGEVYIGTRQGLYKTDALGRHVSRVEVPQRPVNAGVWTLKFLNDVLWLGGIDGLWAIDTSRRELVVRSHFTREQFGNKRIVTLLPAAGNALWLGTSSGVSRVDTVSGRIDNIPTDAADPHSLLNGYVSTLLIDRQGRLWVGSEGSGIQILEQHAADGKPRFRRLGIHDGLPHMGVDKLLLDARGKVWASTDNGLAEIDPDTFAIRSLGESQGVPILGYWADSGASTADGELLFGGQGGLTVVRPLETQPSAFQPPVVVTEASAGGTPVEVRRFIGDASTPWEIPANNRSLMVEFSALDFTSPEENQYSYRLQGFDAEWNPTPSVRRLASYTNLPPGDYVLQLRGSSHEPWRPTTLSIPVRVLAAWYQTLWFKLLVGSILILLVSALVQTRTAFLRRRQRELEELVDRRTADLLQRSEELERSTNELRASQGELERMAYIDPLTGLANRRVFEEELQRMSALVERGSARFSLLLVDLDRFKQVNDHLGHDAGDALLVEVARRLKSVLRASDRACRLGGDEFAVLLPNTTGTAADDIAVCERVLRALQKPFRHRDSSIDPGASIGGAGFPHDASDTESLYKCADSALYEAKNAGRNTWRWYSPAIINT